ncbi:3-deoxy-D-manno-octulosonate 8-phosphate phosphatase KdsC [Vibrio chagasii]|uniref:KdsC family phosphatase n=1 Tax=Vibrio chagasii TaxID=170679 RepID=UPI003384DE27|nr:3-deoxy-D-manno-octulosonate 8-phosphate phosphatase KdsC [Vibrio chagasii]CAH6933544.1 3-deoxy-D-manno-octulosonate 8-phosphate phosphatase KdsC [Vibrio chagasii]CAH7037111.1 3-deoxy-D-manno-octulosonate 8-phosphate phosphatase KdsC [Vibrio chagasii]CAH7062823.1 3-deoxy-D-manno-octulosonate 8-phosphate phosphatase KdsC [Vibrio chagasii]CAH7090494.1 3-deoxy-D-manno-octulosonate 8-phosphate phosphatase KdsC [Vibrio chagasii]
MLDNQVCKNIKMVLLDVDGVMTDGAIYINQEGEFFKSFNVKDGLAIELLRSHNILTGVISGKASTALDTRCQQLGFDEIMTGCKNKLPALMNICSKYQITSDQIAFLGDDVLDIPIFEKVGLAVAPIDAHSLAIDSADWVSSLEGGKGMVREFVDLLLVTQLDKPLKEVYQPLLEKIRIDEVATIEQ